MGKTMKETESKESLIRRYDAAYKEILSQKIILAWIMRDSMDEFSECSPKEIASCFVEDMLVVSEIPVDGEHEEWFPRIHGVNTEDTSPNEGRITYDIRFTVTSPETGRRIWVDVEPQREFRPGYSILKRGFYYLARMISAQRGREFVGSDYDGLKKAYTIWICTQPPKRWENKILHYEIQGRDKSELPCFATEEFDLMTQVVICLGSPNDPQVTGALKLLAILFSNMYDANEKQKLLEEEFDIIATASMRKGMKSMCSLGEGIYESGVEKGILNVNTLYRLLTSEKRFEDLQKAIEDDLYLDQLLEEYRLI